ncbi:hypothetical protein EPUS_04757 [Endocarpon pusillum Z07020]|uniref:Uncharacterized protein n=1 Tax=Endocarpon pusillum (strain Z07020 / HMAS-L-300199) TaxID=1263415 RepID=U1HTX1_ENDPU|nr:uncharacterized protein EPUS_04757 [Endocarpon pusillum Z07020]ERF72704.1 hypothetical protein EPUS_04757 [Endocarpon pusillum Z07020]
MDRIFAIAAYSLAELICFFVGIILGITRYYNGLRFHNIYKFSLSTKQFVGEFLVFVLAEGLIGCLIGLCERQKFKPAPTSLQPIIGLLVSTLLIGLICEVYIRWNLHWKSLQTFLASRPLSVFVAALYLIIILVLVPLGLWLLLSRYNEPVGRVLVALGSFFVHLTFVVIPLYLMWQSQRTQRLSIPVWKRSFLYPGLFGSFVGIVGIVLSVRLHQLHLFFLGENIITAIQLISWIPLLIWNSLAKGRTKNEGVKDETLKTPRSCLKTSSSCGTLDTTGRDQPQTKRDDDIPSGQGSQLDALIPFEDWKTEASNDENNGYSILSYRRSDGTTTHKRVSMPMTQSNSSEPQRLLPVLRPVHLKSTIDHKGQPDKEDEEDEEHKQIPIAGNVCCKFDQGVDIRSNWFPNLGLRGLTTVEKVSKVELSTLLKEHARDMELANPWDEEFHNFTDDGPAPWLDSQTDTRQCILTLFHLLRRGCEYSSLSYSRVSLAFEKTMQHMGDILQESFTDTEQPVAGVLCSASTGYNCKTVLNVLIMFMTIGARFMIQDYCGQVVMGSLEHVQEHSDDMVDLYFEVSDGPSVIFGGWLGWLPFMWAAGPKGPKITLSEDGLALPPSWFLGEAPHVSSSVNSDRDD